MSVKTYFYQDYFALETWSQQQGLTIACHQSVRQLITRLADRHPEYPEVAPYVDRARHISYYSAATLQEKFGDNDKVLWLTVGTAISGITLSLKDLGGSANRWVGVAGCSPFNYGYSGISLYLWENQKLTRQGWWFKDGVLEPREPNAAPLPNQSSS